MARKPREKQVSESISDLWSALRKCVVAATSGGWRYCGTWTDRFWPSLSTLLGRKWMYLPGILLTSAPALLTINRIENPYPWVTKIIAYLDLHPNLSLACLFAPILVGLIGLLREYAKEKSAVGKELNTRELMTILKCLESIVAEKATRFSEHLKDQGFDYTSPFSTITQPQTQYKAIVEATYRLFCLLYPDYSFRVVLARMDGTHICDFTATAPKDQPPIAELESLRTPQSGFSQALKTKQMVIVKNIEKEVQKRRNRKYEPLPGTKPAGSMICIPIRFKHGGTKVPFVLSVTADEPNLFKPTSLHERKWQQIFSYFESRISLEYSLELLKERHNLRGETENVA